MIRLSGHPCRQLGSTLKDGDIPERKGDNNNSPSYGLIISKGSVCVKHSIPLGFLNSQDPISYVKLRVNKAAAQDRDNSAYISYIHFDVIYILSALMPF